MAAAAAVLLGVAGTYALSHRTELQYFTARVELGDVRDVVESTGTINAVTTVLVGSQISGRVAALRADFNSVVHKDEVIAEIDPALFRGALVQAEADLNAARVNVRVERANLEKARAVLAQAKADYDRALTLAKQDSIALQVVDQSRAAYESARASVSASEASVEQAEAQVSQKAGAVDVARTNLQYTVIRSPIDGTVVARNVDVGQTVAASLQAPTLFTIAQDLTKMQVYAKTDESNVGKVKVGREVTFKVDAFPKETFKGVVSQVRMNPTTVQNVVTYDAVIDFDNPEHKLFPGMTAYVTIPVASAERVLKVPNAALRFAPPVPDVAVDVATPASGAQAVVWKLGPDNALEPARIALGITDHSYTAVTGVKSGSLREGDTVVTGAVSAKNAAPGRSLPGGAASKK